MMTNEDTQLKDEQGASGQYDEDEGLKYWGNCKRARTIRSKWYKKAEKNYDYFAGRQWDEEDIRILQEQGRPAVTFNRVPRTVNAVVGLQIQSREEPVCYPVELGDSAYGEYETNVLRYYGEKSGVADEDTEGFRDCLITGMAWGEVFLDTEDVSNPEIKVESIDPREMLYDPKSQKPDASDARWIARVKDLTKEEFEELLPKESFISYSFWGKDRIEGEPHDATNAWRYENDQSESTSSVKTCSVIQYQYWEKVTSYKIQDLNGKMIDADAKQFKKIKPIIEQYGIEHVEYKKKVYKQCLLLKSKIVHSMELKIGMFSFSCMTGDANKNEGMWMSLVDRMEDPQMWANKWLSQVQYIVNSGAKSGLIAEEGALKNPRRAEQEWAVPGSITMLNSGGLGKIMPKEAPRYPEGVDRLLQYAVSAIEDVVGVNLELLGLANRDQAIGLEETRKKAAVTVLATFFDSLRRYRKNQAKIMMGYIREYVPEGTLVRITGEQGMKYIPLMKDKLANTFDIVISEAPNSPNMKERVSTTLMQYIPIALQAGIPIPPDILDYTMLPETLVQKWKTMIMEQKQSPKQAQMQQMQEALSQLELAKMQADIKKTGSETIANYAKAEQYHAVGQDESAQAAQKMGGVEREQQMKYDAMIMEQQRKDLAMVMEQNRRNMQHNHTLNMMNMKNNQQY